MFTFAPSLVALPDENRSSRGAGRSRRRLSSIAGAAIAATFAFAFAISGSGTRPASANTMVNGCQLATRGFDDPAVRSSAPIERTWAVVRVTVDPNGAVRSKRIVWQSGNAAFNTAALAAVAKTRFTPTVANDRVASTFDYSLTSECGANRSTRILPRSKAPHGFAQPSYRVSARNNAWFESSEDRK
jgi:TonB family protein